MLISICVPTFNRPRLVREAIESALAQNYRPIEVVVSDDSTNDVTKQDLTDLIDSNKVRYVRNTPSLGQAENVNRLFDLARGELLVLLHDDDLLLPDAVADLATCFAASPGITAAYGKQYLIGSDGIVDEIASVGLNTAYFRTADRAGRQPCVLLSGLTAQFPNDGYMVRACVAKSVRYRSDSSVGDACDFDFGLRLAAVADGFYFLDKYTAKYRETGQSVSAGNNYTHLTFDLVARVEVPADLEAARQTQMQQFAVSAVNQWLASGHPWSAMRVFRSAAYGWRRRASAVGLFHAALLMCPPFLTRWLIARKRSNRRR